MPCPPLLLINPWSLTRSSRSPVHQDGQAVPTKHLKSSFKQAHCTPVQATN